MHYYQFNISDYRKDTGHLSLLEHAIYRSLIDTYMLEESPLCADNAKLMRTHSVRTKDEVAAFLSVLSDFFILRETGYHLDRCDTELGRIYEKSEKARASAMKRWEKKDAKAMRTHSEGNAKGMLPITYNLIPNKDTVANAPAESKIPVCQHEKIIEIYHEVLPELPKVIPHLWGGVRKKNLNARWKEYPKHQDLDFWRWYFGLVRKSSFHMGDNDRGWQADLGWLVNQTNLAKILGKYA